MRVLLIKAKSKVINRESGRKNVEMQNRAMLATLIHLQGEPERSAVNRISTLIYIVRALVHDTHDWKYVTELECKHSAHWPIEKNWQEAN